MASPSPHSTSWTYMTWDSVNSNTLQQRDRGILHACSVQVEYLRQLKDKYNQLRVPKEWLEYKRTNRGIRHFTDALNVEIFCDVPAFDLTSELGEDAAVDSIRDMPWYFRMTLQQVAQLLLCEGEVEIEHALASSLHGISQRTIVRKQHLELYLDGTGKKKIALTAFALLLLAEDIDDTDTLLHCTPIHPLSPALVIATKSSVSWHEKPQHVIAQENVVETLAHASQPAMDALVDIAKAGGTKIPGPAIIIGLTYGADGIKLFAHIPYRSQEDASGNSYEYLSLQFETFPSFVRPSGSEAEAARMRIRFVRAILCIQHHVAALIETLKVESQQDSGSSEELKAYKELLQSIQKEQFDTLRSQWECDCNAKALERLEWEQTR
ncbi:hypothetical protein OBBRIDRAFT_133104 [Obba rivulosa]|uniref:Uncharacterized protein n=1 Tax=Obba rivulosa TaxID=1052685 RepID=A0A8E2DI45_9APHY|nr:hypothetical protein OBBRIDRAFT_133104 [Obba rivulosa]